MNWGYPGYITLGILLALLVLGGSIAMWLHRERVLALFVSKNRVQELTSPPQCQTGNTGSAPA